MTDSHPSAPHRPDTPVHSPAGERYLAEFAQNRFLFGARIARKKNGDTCDIADESGVTSLRAVRLESRTQMSLATLAAVSLMVLVTVVATRQGIAARESGLMAALVTSGWIFLLGTLVSIALRVILSPGISLEIAFPSRGEALIRLRPLQSLVSWREEYFVETPAGKTIARFSRIPLLGVMGNDWRVVQGSPGQDLPVFRLRETPRARAVLRHLLPGEPGEDSKTDHLFSDTSGRVDWGRLSGRTELLGCRVLDLEMDTNGLVDRRAALAVASLVVMTSEKPRKR